MHILSTLRSFWLEATMLVLAAAMVVLLFALTGCRSCCHRREPVAKPTTMHVYVPSNGQRSCGAGKCGGYWSDVPVVPPCDGPTCECPR